MGTALLFTVSFDFQPVFESLADALRDPIITVGIRVERDCVNKRHIKLSVRHYAFVGGHVHDPSDNAYPVFVLLIFYELAFETERKLVDDGRVDRLGFTRGKTALFKLFRLAVSGGDAEIVRFDDVLRVGDTYGKRSSCLDVLNGFVRLREIQIISDVQSAESRKIDSKKHCLQFWKDIVLSLINHATLQKMKPWNFCK